MVVAFLVVEDDFLLYRLLGALKGDSDALAVLWRKYVGSGLNGQLQGIQQASGIAVGDVYDVLKGTLLKLDPVASVAPFPVGQGLVGNLFQVCFGELRKLEDAASRNQGGIDLKVGVLFSTQGSRASCWLLFHLCTSSTKSIVLWPKWARRSLAASISILSSFTPESTALRVAKWLLVVFAITRARVVLPVPGGP